MKILKISFIGLIALSLLSCKAFLEESVRDKQQLNKYIKNNTEAVSFLYGGIGYMSGVAFGSDYLSVYELPTDQTYFAGSDNIRSNMSSMTYDNNNVYVKNAWAALYKVIGQMNILVDRLENGPLAGTPYAPRVMAQAKFLRAYCYFNAIRLWGQVPITRAYYDTSGDIKPGRSSVEDVYKYIVTDLKDCLTGNNLRNFDVNGSGQKIMPDTVVVKFPNDAAAAATNYFLPVSKGAAQLLLAKVYLTRNTGTDLSDAETLIDAMMATKQSTGGTNLYALLSSYGDLFDSNTKTVANRCREVLFEIEASSAAGIANSSHREMAPNSFGAQEGIKPKAGNYPNNNVVGAVSGYRNYVPTEKFLASFNGLKDKRYFWMYQFNAYSNTSNTWGPEIRKGYDATSTNQDNGYCNAVLLRYADALLIKAELRARANDLSGAKTALDVVLQRAGLDPYDLTGKNQATVLADIIAERAKEFAHEAGNRLFDMRRMGFESQMTSYSSWYTTNVTNSTHTCTPLTGTAYKSYLYYNPKCNGVALAADDQSRGGDYFEVQVPFAEGSGYKKIFSTKCLLSPIPYTQTSPDVGNLNNSMNYPNWN